MNNKVIMKNIENANNQASKEYKNLKNKVNNLIQQVTRLVFTSFISKK